MQDLSSIKNRLLKSIAVSESPTDALRDAELRRLSGTISSLPVDKRAEFGKSLNNLKKELELAIDNRLEEINSADIEELDVTAPMDINSPIPSLLPTQNGTIHPLMKEIEVLSDIFERMGFLIEESREIDDQYHMFETLNFPKGHPARDEYDTFMTTEVDNEGDPLVAPAHTSTMQYRVLRKYRDNLEKGEPIAVAVPDRVFRNEDLDARHEHTFYQCEGVYVAKDVHAGMLVATLQEFLQEYYNQKLEVRVNPFFFPFTEPSFEFALSCPFCEQKGCSVCSHEGWIELLGCGMIHPNVLSVAGIDPSIYTGFAWGVGIDRLVMMKQAIEDVRHFHSAKLDFLRQF